MGPDLIFVASVFVGILFDMFKVIIEGFLANLADSGAGTGDVNILD